MKGPNRNKLISPSALNQISTVYQRNSIIGLDTDNSVGRENSGVQRCVPERSVSSSTNGVTRNSKADPERRPVNRSSSYAIPFLASQRGSNPSLLRSIDSPYAPLNIHETISGTIEPDLHRFYCVPREDLVVNKFFSLSLSQLPRIPSIPLRSKLRETLFTIALCLLSIVHVYPLAKWSGTKVSRARHNRSLCNVC